MYATNAAIESATLLAESADCSNTSHFTFLAIIIVFATIGKFLRPYLSLSALEKAIDNTRHEMATEIVYRRLPSQDNLLEALERLDATIADLRNKLYSSDDMKWIEYGRFFLWTRWKVPLVLNWKAAKIRRRMLRMRNAREMNSGYAP